MTKFIKVQFLIAFAFIIGFTSCSKEEKEVKKKEETPEEVIKETNKDLLIKNKWEFVSGNYKDKNSENSNSEEINGDKDFVVIEFKKDGTFNEYSKNGTELKLNQSGKWVIDSENKKITIDNEGIVKDAETFTSIDITFEIEKINENELVVLTSGRVPILGYEYTGKSTYKKF